MHEANVRLRANVCRSGDPDYIRHLRGAEAISAYLKHHFPTEDLYTAARISGLRPRQIAELAWSDRCDCGAIHEGPVLRNGTETIEFRDSAGRCALPAVWAITVQLDLALVGNHNAHEVSRWLSEALADLPVQTPRNEVRPIPQSVQICVRLTRTQYYFYSQLGIPAFSQIANAALSKYLKSHA